MLVVMATAAANAHTSSSLEPLLRIRGRPHDGSTSFGYSLSAGRHSNTQRHTSHRIDGWFGVQDGSCVVNYCCSEFLFDRVQFIESFRTSCMEENIAFVRSFATSFSSFAESSPFPQLPARVLSVELVPPDLDSVEPVKVRPASWVSSSSRVPSPMVKTSTENYGFRFCVTFDQRPRKAAFCGVAQAGVFVILDECFV